MGEILVIGGFLNKQRPWFYYYEGTARLTRDLNHSVPAYMGTGIGSVIQREGEILVVGKQVSGLSGSAAIGRCGYVGVSHMEYTLGQPPDYVHYGGVVPAHLIDECLQSHDHLWQRCTVIPPTTPLPQLHKCT